MSLKKIIIGEPMPDKNDPKYKERYEREVEAGRKFAEKIKLPWLFGKIQLWANDNRKSISRNCLRYSHRLFCLEHI